MNRYFIVSITLLLSACTDRSQEINQQYHQTKAECLRPPLTRENVVQEADCIGNALILANQQRSSPITWAANERAATLHSAAVEYSEKKISRKELAAEVSAADARYNSLAQQQNALAQQQQQQQRACALALAQAQLSGANFQQQLVAMMQAGCQ